MASKRSYLVGYIYDSFCDLVPDCTDLCVHRVEVSESEELHAPRFAVDCDGSQHLWHECGSLSCDGRLNAGCALRFL